MAKTFKIPFAFDHGGSVVDTESAKKGIIYKCNCGSDVKLRGGDVVSDHFYHIDESNCSLESAIHKAYKAVFERVKQVRLPYAVDGCDLMTFDRIELEKKIDDYIPDAIGYIGDTKYLIEFAKSSYIGERKEKKIQKSNLFCLEIDIIKTVNSISQIERHILLDKSYKHIIHIPEYKEMKELRKNFESAYNKLKNEHKDKVGLLMEKIHQLESQVDLLNELKDGFGLFYKTNCKNGAKMYKRNLGDFRGEIVAFQKNNVISLKFNI